jgi:uncharacterized protein (DUF927 family)
MNSVVYSFLDRLNRNRTMQSALSHYGWVDEGFHAGGTVFGKGGENSYNIKIDPNTSSLYTPVGDLGVWTQCANHILAQNRPAAWTVIASAFAAPLIPFTGTTGSVLSLLSPTSGITGKSTALKVAQSVWGHPVRGIAHLNDTPASVVNRLGVLHNLPSYWDEVRGKEEASEFIKTIFRLSQGKERQRLNSDITQRRSGTWATLLTIATNDSLIDHISNVISNSDAGAARVFEIEAETINDNLDDGTARQFYLRLHDNYGNAGRVYAEFIGSRKEEIKRAVAKYEQQLCKDLHTAGDERFWTSTLTTLLVSAAITNKLNLTKFNLKKFRTYLIKQLRKHRAFKLQEFVQGSASATKTLDQYLHHNVEYTVHADLLPVRGNINSIRIDSLKKPAKIRLAHKSNHIRIITQDFKDWIYATKGAGAEQIVQDLITMGAVVVRGSIDAGSPVSVGVRHRCLDVKFVGAFSHLMPTSGGGSGSVNEDSPEDLNADLSLP